MSYRAEISRIYRTEGLKGFLKGYQGMLLRDGPGFAWYFMSYEFLKTKLGVSDNDKHTEAYQSLSQTRRSLLLLLAGGLAGQSTWVLAYPADFLKTRL